MNQKSGSVLIVDDALIMRRRIADIATAAGWRIAGEADNGVRALEIYQQLRPNLVTLDIVMPEMDGLETLKRLIQFDPQARVVMISAVNQKEMLTRCIESGAADFIVKPFGKDDLCQFFRKQLDLAN